MGALSSCLRAIFSPSGAGGGPRNVIVAGSHVALGKCLGEGGYAFVYAGTLRDELRPEGIAVAAKRFVVRDAETLTNVLTEIELHRALSPHPNIVGYVAHDRVPAPNSGGGAGSGSSAFSTVSRASLLPSEEDVGAIGDVWLIMDKAADSLRSIADRRLVEFAATKSTTAAALAPFSGAEIKKILVDITGGLAHLQSQRPPVAHYDLKLENVLVAADGTYQLCDFGSARRHSITCKTALQVNKAEALLDARMTMLYRPPEACDLWQGITIDTQADMWALGVILYTLLAGAMPFDANPRQILEMQYAPLPAALRGSDEYRALCDICTDGLLVQDPAKRMTVDALSARLHHLDAALHPAPHKLGNVRSIMPPMP